MSGDNASGSQLTAIVTGGAGFIGSHVVDGLVARGWRTVVVDNLSAGDTRNINPAAIFHDLDITSPDLASVFERERPSAVFHLAAQASVSFSVREPVEDAVNNVMGSIHLLRQCARHGVKRFVYSSTGGALYGEPVQLPCPETHPIRPLSPYGASKHAVESYVHCFAALREFGASILRYSNVYGPRQNPEGEAGVVAIFAKRMLEQRNVEIFGSGDQERDFIYVGDVVEANLRALDGTSTDALNIGTGRGATVNEVFRRLAHLTGYRGDPIYREPRPGDVWRITLDSARAHVALGWRPETGLDEGLKQTVEYFR